MRKLNVDFRNSVLVVVRGNEFWCEFGVWRILGILL